MKGRNRTGKEGMELTLHSHLCQARNHVYPIVLHVGMASGFPGVGRDPSIDEYKIIIQKVKQLKNEACSRFLFCFVFKEEETS